MVNSKIILNKDTLVPLGLVVTIIGAIAGGIFWAATVSFGQREHTNQLKDVRAELSSAILALSKQIKDASSDRWTGHDMKVWVELLKAKNPDLVIPMPHN